jgi:hypothetical protein
MAEPERERIEADYLADLRDVISEGIEAQRPRNPIFDVRFEGDELVLEFRDGATFRCVLLGRFGRPPQGGGRP